ncbi:MAG: hypothetical protein ACOYKE_00180 [Ferruginibacter sp.]
MKKYTIIVSLIVVAVLIVFYTWTANKAQQETARLLSNFKEIDRHLTASLDSNLQQKGLGAANTLYAIATQKSKIILSIDSLVASIDKFNEPIISKKMLQPYKNDLIALVQNIQQFNTLKSSTIESAQPDTIKYWSSASEKFNTQIWLETFFYNKPKEAIITYLNFLKHQTTSKY